MSAKDTIPERYAAGKGTLVVTVEWCKACGICMQVCPLEVLGAAEITNRVVVLAPDRCTACGRCEVICPDYVFSIEEPP